MVTGEGPDSHVVLWLLGAFVVTFLVTRLVTTSIHRKRGPFRDLSAGGVHLHHEVFGILLLLGSGTVDIAYRPVSPWREVIAVLFGIGAALTLDEFALWLRLDDVYWGPQGRNSIHAVLIAVLVGVLMLIGLSPFDPDSTDGEVALSVSVAASFVFVIIAILKGRIVLGVVGFFCFPVAFVAACRLARPHSVWARRFYRPGSRRFARARRRFPDGRRGRCEPIVDLFAGRSAADSTAGAAPTPAAGPQR